MVLASCCQRVRAPQRTIVVGDLVMLDAVMEIIRPSQPHYAVVMWSLSVIASDGDELFSATMAISVCTRWSKYMSSAQQGAAEEGSRGDIYATCIGCVR